MSSTRFAPPPGVPTLDNVDGDGFLVPGENDYTSGTKLTLRQYISTLTRGEAPEVNIPGGPIVEYNGPIPDHANAYPLGDGAGVEDYTFTEFGVEGGSINNPQDYSDSGFFNGVNDKTLSDIVSKGESGHAQGREPLSGHFLLQGVVGSSVTNGEPYGRTVGADVLVNAIPEILDENNINSPTRKAVFVDGEGNQTSTITSRVKIDRGNEILSRSPDPNSETVSVKELSKVALDIMLKATGKSEGPDKYPGFTAGLDVSAVQQGYSRVAADDLRASGYVGVAGLNSTVDGTGVALLDSDGVGGDVDGNAVYSNKSYGVVYNPLESFTSLDGSSISYLALSSTAFGSVAVVGGILAGITSISDRKPTYQRLGTKEKVDAYKYMELGKFKFKPDSNGFLDFVESVGISTDVTELLNIYVPTNPYADYGQCVLLGFASLIGTSYSEDDILVKPPLGPEDSSRNINLLGLLNIAVLVAVRIAAIAATGEKGYYMNLFREIVRDSGLLIRSIKGNPASLLSPSDGLASIVNSKIIRFIDTLARIGDMIVLQASAKFQYKFNVEVKDGDPYAKNGFKSNNNAAKTSFQEFAKQRIRGAQFGAARGSHLGVNELPSAHLIPAKYVSRLGSDDQLNVKKLTSFKDSTKSEGGGTNLRIAQDQVAAIEAALDAEYMPFYFHDLRTNEIVSFHAFLEELSDNYQANYNGAGGYGRIEEIKTYKDTKRSVGLTFNIVATNPDDFDYMWWQINKLTTMVYPQWSRGREMKTKIDNQDFTFIQPFSQIPNATPVIRTRVGDLIRSNYSRFNLKRLFGYYDPKTNQDSGVPGTIYSLDAGKYAVDGPAPSSVDIGPTIIGSVKPPTKNIGDTKVYVVFIPDILKSIQVPMGELRENPGSAPSALAAKFYATTENDTNSVIRSFESSMSKGLAGVVTQLQFTWMDNTILWGAGEDGVGKRAPRSCKVQMSIDPIHDIAPGLDHEGFNRAPIYPVGKLVNSIVQGDETEPYGPGSTAY